MDRVFLDANVLFSAVYRSDAGLLRLWRLRNIELLSSAYAVQEAMRNLPEREQRDRLSDLLAAVTLVPESLITDLPAEIALPGTDRPILQAAIASGASHLLAGDKAHFGRYYGSTVQDVEILPPAEYLRRRGRRYD